MAETGTIFLAVTGLLMPHLQHGESGVRTQCLKIMTVAVLILRLAIVVAFIVLIVYEMELVTYVPGVPINNPEKKEVEPEWTVTMPLSEIMKGPIGLEPDNPGLLKVIREKYLIPPADGPYNLNNPADEDPSTGHADAVREILNNLEGGFYIECGGFDGETWSNTLLFERSLNWNGILIEADINNFKTMMQKGRKAWAMHNCLSVSPYPAEVMFEWGAHASKISNEDTSKAVEGMEKVQCLPIYSVLLALNVTTVHLFSLDVEGSEVAVLNTVPWDKLDIWVLLVEHLNVPGGAETLDKVMEPRGYVSIKEVAEKNKHLFGYDSIFVRSDILQTLTKKQ